ncbi:hypothetical protein N7501_011110 [Penicillium viridicatum]|nr:hypothetical protein N7501_011110 [Penicillium viridicatum]
MARFIWTLASCSLFLTLASAGSSCKPVPGDEDWPSAAKWSKLNNTVNGHLIATTPLPSVCHNGPIGTYDADACTAIRDEWTLSTTFIYAPAEAMGPYFQNQSCDPFSAQYQPCLLDNYASYSLNVTGASDVVAGIKFSQDNNVRLVIKNTGHDFTGKSTGKGSLSLWMHNLNTTTVIPEYKSTNYTGPAAKLGAGVVAANVYTTVSEAGYRILGGTCPSVGLAGGYTSGGGHSLLNGLYGMAADAVLEWEVITASGEHLIATPTSNEDLYWALSGGGAGNLGVVLSMTTKIFPEGIIGSASLAFNSTDPNYWPAMEALFMFLPEYVDAGPNAWDFVITQTGFTSLALTAPNLKPAGVQDLLQPLLDTLDDHNISYSFTPESFPTYHEYFNTKIGTGINIEPANINLASRLIPRSAVQNVTQTASILTAMKAFIDAEHWVIGCHAFNVADIEHPDNAVFSKWREAVANCNIVDYWDWDVSWDEMMSRKSLLVNTLIPGLEAATPGSGTYLNEIDAQYKGDWKTQLYAETYDPLLRLKEKYDPGHLFYARTAPGSDYYTTDGAGRLCKA